MKSLKTAALSGIGFAALFAVFSLLFYFGDWPRLALVTCAGLFVGLVAAPELEPKAFRHAWLLQLLSGLMAGALLGWGLGLGIEAVILATVVGGLLGWSAPWWVKHVQVP